LKIAVVNKAMSFVISQAGEGFGRVRLSGFIIFE
jgi:hypothetical protein